MMTTIREAMEARYPNYVFERDMVLFEDDGKGNISIRSDLWDSTWGACPTIETVLSWLE